MARDIEIKNQTKSTLYGGEGGILAERSERNMTPQILSQLYQVGNLLYATTNVYSLVIDVKKKHLIEVPKCHLNNCFCQRIAKCVGIDISYDHIYKRCDISTNVNRQIIYKCPFGFSNIIVPVFQGKELVAALQAGPVLSMDPDEYMEKRVLPLWNLSEQDLEELKDNLRQYPRGDTNYLVALSENMSALIDGGNDKTVIPPDVLEASDHRISNNLVNSILDFITSNYAENITLSDAARYAYVNPSHLSRVFNKKMNCNFRSYLNNIRVEKAKELLISSDLSIADIGNQVGFSDQSYFNKIFKEHEGMTPGQYRRRRRNI